MAPRWWLGALGAGLLLAVLLVVLAPASIVVHVGEPGGLVPPMLSGVNAPERNYGHPIRWTTGRARLRWPGRFGAQPAAVVITLAGFPSRQPDQLEVRVNGLVSRHAVPEQYSDIRVRLADDTRVPLDIEITSLATRPPADGRLLGVRLETVTIENQPLVRRLRAIAQSAGVVVLGAMAWLAGAWAAGAGATRARRLRSAALGWGVTAVAAWVLAPTALRPDTWLTLSPVLVGGLALVVLARAGHAPLVACVSGLVVTLQGLVIVTWCVAAFVDAPRWDIWDIVPLLVKQEARGLSLGDLWAPHNEHRPAVARAVMLANVAVSRWNHWNELWVMLVVTAVHLMAFVAYLRHVGQSHRLATIVLVAGVGTFVASATQWENFLQGWQIALVAGAAAISWAFVLLTVGTLTWTRMAVAAMLVSVGTAGFGSCLLGWPLGAVAIALHRGPDWLRKAGIWLVLGVAIGVAYVHGLVRPAGLPPPSPILTSITAVIEVAWGTSVALAMPVWYVPMSFNQTESAAWWLLPAIGASGILLAIVMVAAHLLRADTRRARTWLAPSLLMAFAVGACALTAVGRVPLGIHAMTASRYIAFTVLFWIGLLLLLTVATPFRSRVARGAALAVAISILVAGVRAWGDSLPWFEQHYVTGVLGREALLREDWNKTVVLFPVAPVLDERRQFLKKHQLSLYRPGAK